MKTNNRQLHMEWIACAAALVILILLLSSCDGTPSEESMPSVPETTVQTTAAEETVELPSEAVPEAAAPSEAETEPTQATEAEETSSGTVSAGTVDLTHTSDEVLAMYPSIEKFGEEPEEETDDAPVEVPAPGTQKNPYVEMLAGYPAQVLSVNIPAGESASYLILGSAGTVVTVDDPAITLSQGEEPAPASETDTVALDLGNAVDDPVIRLSNTGTEPKACTVSLVEALGIKTNPEPVTDNTRIAVKLAEGDLNGHHYLWTAPAGGQLILSTESEILEIMLPDYGELLVPAAEGPENIVLRVEEGEKLLIHAMAVPGEDGLLPEVETEILLQWTPDAGTAENPEEQVTPEETEEAASANLLDPLPGTEAKPMELDPAMETVNLLTLSAGETLYCCAEAEGMLLTLTGTDVTLIREGVEYPAQEGGVVLTIREPETVFALRSDSEQEQTLELVFTYPLGREENPLWLDMTDQVTIPAGKTMYCAAKADGMVMTMKGDDLSVIHNGREYCPEKDLLEIPCHGASAFEPPVFTITNKGEADVICDISFDYPQGHFMNPVPLELGSNAVRTGEGVCYFQWFAQENGTLTVTMEGERGWEYVLNNLTAGVNGEVHDSQDAPPVPSQTVEVTAGDEIQLIFHPEEAPLIFSATFVPLLQPTEESE